MYNARKKFSHVQYSKRFFSHIQCSEIFSLSYTMFPRKAFFLNDFGAPEGNDVLYIHLIPHDTWYTCTWLENDVMVPLKPLLSLNPVGLLIVKWNAHVSLCKANSISPRHHLMTRAMQIFMRINSQSLDSGHNDEALMIRSGWWHNTFSILLSYFFSLQHLDEKFWWEGADGGTMAFLRCCSAKDTWDPPS